MVEENSSTIIFNNVGGRDLFIDGETIRFTSLYDSPTKASIPAAIVDEEEKLADLPFHKVTWVASHNAHANNFAAGDNIVRQVATNQEYSIYQQLKEFGVRGIMIDVKFKDGGLKLVHGLVEFAWLEDIINHEIIPFLEEDRNAIITIDMETLGNREQIMRGLRVLLHQTGGFASRIFRIEDNRWAGHTEWPTIKEMRDADQRIVFFSDSSIVQSDELGIMVRNMAVIENHWSKGLDKCSPRNEYIEDLDIPWANRNVFGRNWTRLFLMNHFCCATGIESLHGVKPEGIGGGDNGWGILYPRVIMCISENKLSIKPNYIAIDWAHIGDAHEVADYLNFGGRLGTGQRCKSGLDCATGSCSLTKRCHCQICNASCSGCASEETCTTMKETGMNQCISNVTGAIMGPSSAANAIHFQSVAFTILPAMVLLRMLFLC